MISSYDIDTNVWSCNCPTKYKWTAKPIEDLGKNRRLVTLGVIGILNVPGSTPMTRSGNC
jgi:hypothetical protein